MVAWLENPLRPLRGAPPPNGEERPIWRRVGKEIISDLRRGQSPQANGWVASLKSKTKSKDKSGSAKVKVYQVGENYF